MSSFVVFSSLQPVSLEQVEEIKSLTLQHAPYLPSSVEVYLHPSRRSGIIELCGFETCLNAKIRKANYFYGMAFQPNSERFLNVADISRRSISPESIHGSFHWVSINESGQVNVDYDPLLNIPVYFSECDGIAFASDRLSVCAALAKDRTIDPLASAWIVCIGYVAGDRTRFAAVRRAPIGGRLVLQGGRVYTPSPSGEIFASKSALPDVRREFRRAVAAACKSHINAHGSLRLGMTGGKDSRLVLAIVLEAGLEKDVEFYVYDFAAEQGGGADAIVARAIAAKYGLALEAIPRTSAAAAAPEFDRLLQRLTNHAAACDGLLSGWDIMGLPAPSSNVSVSGAYGEIVKHYFKRPTATHAFYGVDTTIPTLDPTETLKPGAKERLANYLAAQLEPLAPAGASSRDFADLFYITNRMPNWGGPTNSAHRYGQRALHPLYNRELLKLPFGMTYEQRSNQAIHFEIINDVSVELAAMPFANDRWHKSLTTPTDEVKDPPGIPKHGGWQHTLTADAALVGKLTEFVDASEASWTEYHDKSKMIALMRSGISSAHVSSILGVVTSTIAETTDLTQNKGKFRPSA